MLRVSSLVLAITLLLTACTPTPRPTEVLASGDPAAIAAISEVLNSSIAKANASGMTERLSAEGENYLITFEPAEKFEAVVLHLELDDVVKVDRLGVFSIWLLQELLAKSTSSVVTNEGGFTVETSDLGTLEVSLSEGLITSVAATNEGWRAEITFQTDPELLNRSR